MAVQVSRRLAQQIVDTIADVCGYNINFIRPDGNIYASTNPGRIGTFHEAGRRAAMSGKTMEVETGTDYAGTMNGINIPVYYHHVVIAVIGITAPPQEARRYAHLAERVTAMLLHEQEAGEHFRTLDEQRLYVIRCLQTGEYDSYDYLEECLEKFHISEKDQQFRLIAMRVNTRYNLVNISLLEQKVQNLFGIMNEDVYAYIYPNQFAGLLHESSFQHNRYMLDKFARDTSGILKCGVGSACDLKDAQLSWQCALTALSSAQQGQGENLCVFDDLKLEILLSQVSRENRQTFQEKILGKLREQDKSFLKVYYEEDMSLKRTAQRLYLHKNTVQQRLVRIQQETGMDPRKFREAVLFYLGLNI